MEGQSVSAPGVATSRLGIVARSKSCSLHEQRLRDEESSPGEPMLHHDHIHIAESVRGVAATAASGGCRLIAVDALPQLRALDMALAARVHEMEDQWASPRRGARIRRIRKDLRILAATPLYTAVSFAVERLPQVSLAAEPSPEFVADRVAKDLGRSCACWRKQLMRLDAVPRRLALRSHWRSSGPGGHEARRRACRVDLCHATKVSYSRRANGETLGQPNAWKTALP